VGSLVAYPVENPVSRSGSTPNDGNFVNLAARNKGAAADWFQPVFSSISSGTAVIRSGSDTPLSTTRGGIA
jgi:hypothetical protein